MGGRRGSAIILWAVFGYLSLYLKGRTIERCVCVTKGRRESEQKLTHPMAGCVVIQKQGFDCSI